MALRIRKKLDGDADGVSIERHCDGMTDLPSKVETTQERGGGDGEGEGEGEDAERYRITKNEGKCTEPTYITNREVHVIIWKLMKRFVSSKSVFSEPFSSSSTSSSSSSSSASSSSSSSASSSSPSSSVSPSDAQMETATSELSAASIPRETGKISNGETLIRPYDLFVAQTAYGSSGGRRQVPVDDGEFEISSAEVLCTVWSEAGRAEDNFNSEALVATPIFLPGTSDNDDGDEDDDGNNKTALKETLECSDQALESPDDEKSPCSDSEHSLFTATSTATPPTTTGSISSADRLSTAASTASESVSDNDDAVQISVTGPSDSIRALYYLRNSSVRTQCSLVTNPEIAKY